MPVYLGISCVKGGRGERRGGGGGRVEKEVESSTTLAGVTLEELEQTLLGEKQGRGRGREGRSANVNTGSLMVSQHNSGSRIESPLSKSLEPRSEIGKRSVLPGKHARTFIPQ